MATATFAEGVAECRAQRLGVSACLDRINPLCDGNPEVTVLSGSGPTAIVDYKCARPISPQQAVALLKEAEAVVSANKPVPWLLIGGGAFALALVAYVATR